MKLTFQLQLILTTGQEDVLLDTMERFNAAASLAAKVGFEAGVFGQPSIHKLAYADIRERTTVRAKDRARRSGWAFAKSQAFAHYKAKLAGLRVVLVDARDTSRTCSACGHCEKANRKCRSEFACQHRGFSDNADRNAARNVRDRVVVKRPDLAANDDPGLERRAS